MKGVVINSLVPEQVKVALVARAKTAVAVRAHVRPALRRHVWPASLRLVKRKARHTLARDEHLVSVPPTNQIT